MFLQGQGKNLPESVGDAVGSGAEVFASCAGRLPKQSFQLRGEGQITGIADGIDCLGGDFAIEDILKHPCGAVYRLDQEPGFSLMGCEGLDFSFDHDSNPEIFNQ